MLSHLSKLAIAFALGCGLELVALPASADGGTDAYVTATPNDDGSVTVGAAYSGSHHTSSDATRNASSPIQCSYPVLGSNLSALMGSGPGGASDGVWVLPFCTGEGYVNPLRPVWLTTSAPQPRATASEAARRAIARLGFPGSGIHMAPSTSQPQLVGERTWMWIDPTIWQDLSATASVGAVSATATATPSHVVWEMGDGGRVTCNGPGVPYDSSKGEAAQNATCTYVWPRSSTKEPGAMFTVTATIVWRVTWTAVGAPGGGSLGPLNSPPSQVQVQVTDGDALNTSH